MPNTVTPNMYHLSGHSLHVTYTTTSLDGQPTMSYQDAHQAKSFHGDQLRIVPNHACVVTNMVDAVHIVEGDALKGTWPIVARGHVL